MKKFLLIPVLILVTYCAGAQSSTNAEKLKQAKERLAAGDHHHALAAFRKLHAQMSASDASYGEVANGLFETLYGTAADVKAVNDWNNLLDISTEALQILDQDAQYFDTIVGQKRYKLYENIIVAHFGTKQRLLATGFQQKLLEAYKNQQLRGDLKEQYNFEKMLSGNTLNVFGYEKFVAPNGDDLRNNSRIAYHVYTRNQDGTNKEELYSLEIIKVAKPKANAAEYVLAKRTTGKKQDTLEIFADRTYTASDDYAGLHDALMACLEGKLSSGTITPIKNK